MNVTLFGAKRAHHRAVAIWAPRLAPLRLTPARLEVLHAISRQRTEDIWQADLVLLLGCAASTLSRMLKALEGLGFVYRCWPYEITRPKLVALTKAGSEVLKAALALVNGARAATVLVEEALSAINDVERGRTHSLFVLLRLAFGDPYALDPYDGACEVKLRAVSPHPVFDD